MKGKLFCHCECGFSPKMQLLNVLEKIEKLCGFELTINSAARCEKHNAEVGGSKNSAHTLGLAADISYENSNQLYLLNKAIFSLEIKRTGLNPNKKFRHIDIATGPVPHPIVGGIQSYPQDVDFSYPG